MSSPFVSAITPSVCASVTRTGFAVLDNVFGGQAATQFRDEVVSLYEKGSMRLNETHLVRGEQTHHLQKARVHEAELTLSADVQARAPLCSSLAEDRALATMLSLHLPQLTLDSQAIKLQYNAGEGGCFPIHVDSDPSVDGRVMTCIFYLNPGWQPSHGGQLQLYPWPRPPVSIEPLHDRLVIFSSQRMLHRVLPFNGANRCCFTIWLSQSPRARKRGNPKPTPPSASQPNSPEEDPEAALQFLLSPAVRLHAAKLAYAAEWRASLAESHPPGPALDAFLDRNGAEVGIIERALGRYAGLLERLQRDPAFAEQAAQRHVRWVV